MRIWLVVCFILFQSSVCFSEIQVNIAGIQGTGGAKILEAHVHPFPTNSGQHIGLVTLTHPFIQTEPSTEFFFNSSFGIAMNQNVTFSGTPEVIFDGTDSGAWTSTLVSGIWDFADGGKVTITTAENLDNAIWDDTGTINMSGHTALTGKIDLDIYSPVNNAIIIQFGLAGVDVGDSVNLNDFIDTGDFTEQSFAIPKSNFDISSETVDDMDITIIRLGGSKPTIKFDDFQIEEIGEPAIFSLNVDQGNSLHITELVFTYADALVSEKTGLADATEAFTNDFLSYDAILGVSALSNGFVITRRKAGGTLFSATIRTLGQHISAGATIGELFTDNANTFITLRVVFPQPLILTGKPDDTLTVTINDDMSGLLQFTAAGRGGLESNGQ